MIRFIIAALLLVSPVFSQSPDKSPCWTLNLDDIYIVETPFVHECPAGMVPDRVLFDTCRGTLPTQAATIRLEIDSMKATFLGDWVLIRDNIQSNYNACTITQQPDCGQYAIQLCGENTIQHTSYATFISNKNDQLQALNDAFHACMNASTPCVTIAWPVCGFEMDVKQDFLVPDYARILTIGWSEPDIQNETNCWNAFQATFSAASALADLRNSNAFAQYQLDVLDALDVHAYGGDCGVFRASMLQAYRTYDNTFDALGTQLTIDLDAAYNKYFSCVNDG